MGRISKKLAESIRQVRELSPKSLRQKMQWVATPEDLKSPGDFAREGLDPLHSLYLSAQHLTSYIAEMVSELPEFRPYCDIVIKAEDEYLPQGPPMSPLTGTFFYTWALFDLQFGKDSETICGCLLDVAQLLELPEEMVAVLRSWSGSRMGIYEHVGTRDRRVQLRELVTNESVECIVPAGYLGVEGELWYVRLCPPLFDIADYHIAFTTPYILGETSKEDWTAYLRKSILKTRIKDSAMALRRLFKVGFSVHHWNEFVFEAFHHSQFDAIFLAGLPDVAASRPHASIED